MINVFKPRHDKTNVMRLRPAWNKSSLRVRAVWSESMLFAITCSNCNSVGKRIALIMIRLRAFTGWSVSRLVANALCWFCHDVAHFNSCWRDTHDNVALWDLQRIESGVEISFRLNYLVYLISIIQNWTCILPLKRELTSTRMCSSSL
jgi:hypothetical protein